MLLGMLSLKFHCFGKFYPSGKGYNFGNTQDLGMSPAMDPPEAVIHSAKGGESNGLNRKPESSPFIPFVSGFLRRLLSSLVISRATRKLGR